MTNNDVLRRIRFSFDINDSNMIKIFGLGGLKVTREDISNWLKKDDDPAYKACTDLQFASFLNGFITEKRGKKEGEDTVPENQKPLNNNIIFMKLKIALNLKSDDVLDMIELADFRLGKHELSAFFRKPGHKHYRECKDQVLRYFLTGMQIKYRDVSATDDSFKWK